MPVDHDSDLFSKVRVTHRGYFGSRLLCTWPWSVFDEVAEDYVNPWGSETCKINSQLFTFFCIWSKASIGS